MFGAPPGTPLLGGNLSGCRLYRQHSSGARGWMVVSPIPSKVREQVAARSHGLCEARITTAEFACKPGGHHASHMHHVLLLSRGGKHEASNLVHLCHEAHLYVHANPEWALGVGLMRSSWDSEPGIEEAS